MTESLIVQIQSTVGAVSGRYRDNGLRKELCNVVDARCSSVVFRTIPHFFSDAPKFREWCGRSLLAEPVDEESK